jgi:hypothetical protein
MDDLQFDRFARAVAGVTSRRGLLGVAASAPVVGGALALFDPEDIEAKKRKKKKRKKKKKNKCTPDAKTTTCNGKCGSVINNCKQTVDCGSCACNPPCGECFQCNTATATCVPETAGTACGAGPSCDSGLELFQDTCDGAGTCQPGGGQLCGLYLCAGNACGTTCAGDTDCEPNAYCTGGACTQKSANGLSCQADNECSSNNCCSNVCRDCCDNGDCSGSTPICLNNACVVCGDSPGGCPNGSCCNQPTGECVADCPGTQLCAVNNICTPPCQSIADCGANQLCVAGICQDCDVTTLQSDLQAAIDNTPAGGTLYVCPGAYAPNQPEIDFLIAQPITIIGAGDGASETRVLKRVHIDGAGSPAQPVILRDLRVVATFQGVWLQGGNLLMERCTVRGSSSSAIGVDNAGGTLEMRRCDVVGNKGPGFGGGIRNTGGSVVLRNCRIEGNSAQSGAGIVTANGATSPSSFLELHNTEVRGNVANGQVNPTGAGILNVSGESNVTISTDSIICENNPDATQCDGLVDTSRCSAICPD